MKTIFDCRMINNSGIGTYVEELLYYFLKDKKLSLILISNNESDEKVKEVLKNSESEVEIIFFKSLPFSLREQYEYITKLPKNAKIFIPHINIPFFVKKNSLFITIHDAFHLANPHYYSKLAILYFKFLFKIIKRNAYKIFTVSEFSKTEILRFITIDQSKIEVIYNGYKQMNKIDCTDIDENVKQKLDSFNKIILFVGNVKPHKNLKFLVDSFNKLNREDVLLLIVGKKDSFFINDNIDNLGKDNIFFTGFVNESTLKYVYEKSSFLIFPSKYEGFGLPILEAMYFRKLILASDIPVFKEIFGDEINYFEIEIENSLINEMNKLLVKDNDLKNYDLFLEKFTWTISGEKHEKSLEL
ncbi:glycosyltransferase family 4 protein [Chryseobacterium oryzae]|uniref:Glycosyltransferase family 4 protein n=1 Tax=Chryseobacterium oryzae TaxID=2929799 RepID=A0ABY4BG21_9FLAO|nr:glycosyltransferase family 1 protein [Chryseobacterium oryzae]UOE37217.1 glycosyltransferase family 4 protein [Chryseobacterium oryzae]